MPALSKPISREYRIYLALWRKAFFSEEPIIVTASSFSMAVAMRQGMYRAIRPFRNGQLTDEALRQASEKYVVFLEKVMLDEEHDKTSPHHLIFKERKTLAALDGMLNLLGLDEEDLLLGEERTVGARLSKFLDEKTPSPVVPSKTPYYER